MPLVDLFRRQSKWCNQLPPEGQAAPNLPETLSVSVVIHFLLHMLRARGIAEKHGQMWTIKT